MRNTIELFHNFSTLLFLWQRNAGTFSFFLFESVCFFSPPLFITTFFGYVTYDLLCLRELCAEHNRVETKLRVALGLHLGQVSVCHGVYLSVCPMTNVETITTDPSKICT